MPMAIKTWAPVGQTPQLRVPLTRDHLSSMSAISPDGRLFLQVWSQSYDADAVVGFLRVLLRKIPGKLLIIWDGSPIHRSKLVKAFLARGAAKRIHLEQLPGYAPDLNPDEGIWNYLKRRELANVCCRTLQDLEQELMRARERLRHKRSIIRSCFLQCGYV
ncbi:MAG TPA: transposase [Ktedonobacteraceae bacterium]|nr:transposase [Ktedonobacteraceae bacterium]